MMSTTSTPRRKPQAVAAAEDALLRCVRARGLVARGDLAQVLGLVPSTIGVYVERLVRDGFLRETVPSERGLGRPPVLLELNPRKGRFIGVDFDARHVMGIAVDFSQQPLERAQRTLPAGATTAQALESFEQVITELIGSPGDDVLGIGLGLPGMVDASAGIALQCKHIDDWRNVPIVQHLQLRFQKPVSIEHNLRSLALAEYWFGQGRGVSRLACLGVRTGIGLGIVLDGQLYRGATNFAGEVGSWICYGDSGTATQTVESVASVSALMQTGAQRLADGAGGAMSSAEEPLTLPVFIDAVKMQDTLALELLRDVALRHAWLTHNLVCVLDPDRIILAGPLVELPNYWSVLQGRCAELGGESLTSRILPSQLGSHGGALGAAAIAVQNWTPR